MSFDRFLRMLEDEHSHKHDVEIVSYTDVGIYSTWQAYPEKYRFKSLIFQTIHPDIIEDERPQ